MQDTDFVPKFGTKSGCVSICPLSDDFNFWIENLYQHSIIDSKLQQWSYRIAANLHRCWFNDITKLMLIKI